MNFSVLIVDDEFYICEGIKTKLEHLNFPEIKDIRVCYSGEEALELCETFRPSIVITDIKMDGINGIRLIHELKKKLHPVRFLVLSGYDNYEYVRSSFQEGAADYLLKPILSDQLKDIILKQLDYLKNTAVTDTDSRASAVHLAEQLFESLHNPLSSHKLEELTKNLPFRFCQVITISWLTSISSNPKELLDDIYNHYLKNDNIYVLACITAAGKIFVVLNADSADSFPVSFWKDFILSSSQKICLELAAGISNVKPVSNLPALYYESENQLARRLTDGYRKIYHGTTLAPPKEFPSKLRQLTQRILTKPELLTDNTTWNKMTSQLEQLSLPELKRFYNYFSGTCFSFFSAYDSNEIAIRFKSFYDFAAYTELEQYIYSKFYECLTYSLQNPKDSIELVKNYLDEHFTESLTMNDLAEKFFISYSHLSRQFHDKIGMSFQEYLISKRMTYASELLRSPELTIQEVASMSGYDNVFNFSRSFKKFFGVAPNHYRNL